MPVSHDWYERSGPTCRHGYEHGDCPSRCVACGHRCELHPADPCEAVECGCPEWADPDPDDEEPSSILRGGD